MGLKSNSETFKLSSTPSYMTYPRSNLVLFPTRPSDDEINVTLFSLFSFIRQRNVIRNLRPWCRCDCLQWVLLDIDPVITLIWISLEIGSLRPNASSPPAGCGVVTSPASGAASIRRSKQQRAGCKADPGVRFGAKQIINKRAEHVTK